MFKTSKSRIYLVFGLNFSSDNYYKLHVPCIRHCNSSVCFRVYYINDFNCVCVGEKNIKNYMYSYFTHYIR